MNIEKLQAGFSKLNRNERLSALHKMGFLSAEDIGFIKSDKVIDCSLAENLIENVIGFFQIPLGVAQNFKIDGKNYVIPMAVEETSIIAALSKMAKWIRAKGKITTKVLGSGIIGQIQFSHVKNFAKLKQTINDNKASLIAMANENIAANMVKRGGGVTDLWVREQLHPQMAVIHLKLDPCDAMGANLINQVLEYLKAPIEKLTNENVAMCILSNLNDQKLTSAVVEINDVTEELGQRIEQASIFAEIDPYRATTHNKGVMNGIDPVLIATGNDWRAVEASVHAYAAKDGRYSSITKWRYKDKILYGEITAPIVVGVVGGVTSLHPMAKIALKMMQVTSADHLSRIIAAVGLVQNLGALRALCTEGIIKGHMKLHVDNLILTAGATSLEKNILKQRLQEHLSSNNNVSASHAREFLQNIRQNSLA